ncbi:hypothetical protein ACJIZ3_002980 [Penstemon smallii]|uniref:Uncharacterized protein n=1 Tax=Penstemon smallii TaxID=265156 RepID=A0ABD3U941_9LAMI
MVMSDQEITRLHRVRKTLMQMLRDRGYLVGDFEIEMTKNEFLDKYGENMKKEDLTISKSLLSDDSEKIYVFFLDKLPKLGIDIVREYIGRMEKDGVPRAILVVQQKLTRIAWTHIGETSTKFHLEVFQEFELLINVKEHVLVPEHQLLTPEEKKTLLERYTLKENQLPRIQATDPIARYYGLKRGQVVKIIRPSETSGRYVTYRYVV